MPKVYSQVVIVMMSGAILGGIAFGLASDRFGRRRMMIVALLGALAVVPLWAFSSSMGLIVAGAFLMQFMVQGAWGIIPAHISELSPDQVRGFLPGFSYQCGNLIAASIAWAQAALAERLPYPHVMAASAAAIFALAIVADRAGPRASRYRIRGNRSQVGNTLVILTGTDATRWSAKDLRCRFSRPDSSLRSE